MKPTDRTSARRKAPHRAHRPGHGPPVGALKVKTGETKVIKVIRISPNDVSVVYK